METRTTDMVDSVETLKAAIDQVRAAQRIFAGYSQEQVDKNLSGSSYGSQPGPHSSGQTGCGRDWHGHRGG